MSGKRAVVALIAALLAFGYLFTMNPGMVDFRVYPGGTVSTSLALVLFLFFLAGFGLAVVGSAFKEALRSFGFWRRQKGDQRREQAKRLLVKGRSSAVLGRTRAARRQIALAYRKAPGEPLIAIEMARAEIADGESERAERRLKTLLQDDPRNPEILSLLLEVYRGRNDFEGQVATLTRWLEADPEHLETYRALRDLYRTAGNWAEAVRVQEKVLARTQARAARSAERRTLSEFRLRRAEGLPPAEAKDALARLAGEDEGFAPAHEALGRMLFALGDREGAVQRWLRGYQATGQVGLLLEAERVRVEDGKAAEMLKLYKKLAKKGGAATLLRARLLLELERAQEALETLEAAEPGVGGSRLGRLLQGEALFRLRSYDGAAGAFREGAVGAENELPLAFSCRSCGRASREWRTSCPNCGGFDQLVFDLGAPPLAGRLPAPA